MNSVHSSHRWTDELSGLVKILILNDVTQATKYLSPTLVVRATRRRYAGRILRGARVPIEVTLTAGRPNYRERAFIRSARRAGEVFPVRRIQLRRQKGV